MLAHHHTRNLTPSAHGESSPVLSRFLIRTLAYKLFNTISLYFFFRRKLEANLHSGTRTSEEHTVPNSQVPHSSLAQAWLQHQSQPQCIIERKAAPYLFNGGVKSPSKALSASTNSQPCPDTLEDQNGSAMLRNGLRRRGPYISIPWSWHVSLPAAQKCPLPRTAADTPPSCVIAASCCQLVAEVTNGRLSCHRSCQL